MTPPRLLDKVAIITGSDSGIGRASAEAFAHEGADMVVTYLHDAEGAEVTRKAVEAAGRTGLVVQLDISDEDQVAATFDQAFAAFGTIAILMNNAGVDASGTDVGELSTQVWDTAIRTNVYGPFLCSTSRRSTTRPARGAGP